MTLTISFQGKLSRNIPNVVNNKDYHDYKSLLSRIDEILNITGMDFEFAEQYISQLSDEPNTKLTAKQIDKYSRYAITGLRSMIVKHLTGTGFRELSVRLAESTLLQWFCQIGGIDKIQVPSKSQLQRYSVFVSEDYIRELIAKLFDKASGPENILNLNSPFNAEDVYLDATCLKANIHFPVDWLLLKDGMISLLKSIIVIRKHGLKHRIKPPEEFINRVNNLSIEMTNSRRKPDSKKISKEVFRKLKKLSKIIRAHAARYYKLLKYHWNTKTDLSEGHVNEILKRIDNILRKLPEAIRQAHCRIITGLQIKSKEKILSLFDDSARVVKRGKSGAEVEFGNTLFIAEQSDGFIVDWKLYRPSAPSDPTMTIESLKRISDSSIGAKSIAGDRGCDSKNCRKFMVKNKMINNICPRNPHELIERLQSEEFRLHQTRRSQTEGRIGILKNKFTGSPIRNKKFEYKETSVAWAVLIHNLWVLARLDHSVEANLKMAA
jgi:hypothetical protein